MARNRTSFKKGEHRGGRAKGTPNKLTQASHELAAPYCERAFQRLAELMEQQAHLPTAAKAAEILLAYGYGRPRQTIEHTGANGLPVEFTLDLGMSQEARARRNGGERGNGGS